MGMNSANKRLSSWQSAQKQVVAILASLNKQPDLMLAAAANPLLALRELGYEIDPQVEQEFEDRIRFGTHYGPRLAGLRQQIFQIAGRQFDLDSAEELAAVLSSLTGHKHTHNFTPVETAPVVFTLNPNRPTDPL